jgi:hypothetical protein
MPDASETGASNSNGPRLGGRKGGGRANPNVKDLPGKVWDTVGPRGDTTYGGHL